MAALREEIEAACAVHGLTVLGVTDNHVLIGMAPEAWAVFQGSPEFTDGQPDPLDRWSQRILPDLAVLLGAEDIVYPFGGPPYAPFIQWAFDSGETFSSPVGMLVHRRAGFWVSFRGALALNVAPSLTDAASPCEPCDKPCATACPVGALSADHGYDVPRCKAHVGSPAGRDCLTGGCLVRRACPVSQAFGRDPDQSAFHMAAFLGV